MDCASDPECQELVVVAASQTAKTEALNNIIGYYIDADPAAILAVFPTERLGRTWSKDRLAPMLRDTQTLRGKVREGRAAQSRRSGSEILEKKFEGGFLAITGANAPSGLSHRPARVVIGDEIDRWEASAGSEGDPLELAAKRSTNYSNAFHAWVSSPGVEGVSRIWRKYEQSDRRRYWVPCLRCGALQLLSWSQVRWEGGSSPEANPSSAVYQCEHCSDYWSDDQRWDGVDAGQWIAQRPFARVAGFWLPGLYSPWIRLSTLVKEWINALGNPEEQQVFVNTRLAELWKEGGKAIDPESLLARRERYPEDSRVPKGVLVVTAGVDVQDDRLEIERLGTGEAGETWSIDYTVISGDPASILRAEDDTRLPDLLFGILEREDGAPLRVARMCIDSGGHFTEEVYAFAKRYARRGVYATKGQAGAGKPLWPARAAKKTSKKRVGRVAVTILGVDTGKSTVLNRLKREEPGPGYCHFPERPEYDEEYFAQLTAERPVRRRVRGRAARTQWVQTYPRNEAFDCRVLATASVAGLAPNWQVLKRLREQAAHLRGRPGAAVSSSASSPSGPELARPRGRRVISRGVRV